MITAPRVAFLVPLALLLVACESKSDPVAPRLQAMSFTNSEWSQPVNLSTPVNSSFAEFQPDLSHDGRTLLFIAGAGRAGEGGFDIWMSTRTANGKEDP